MANTLFAEFDSLWFQENWSQVRDKTTAFTLWVIIPFLFLILLVVAVSAFSLQKKGHFSWTKIGEETLTQYRPSITKTKGWNPLQKTGHIDTSLRSVSLSKIQSYLIGGLAHV